MRSHATLGLITLALAAGLGACNLVSGVDDYVLTTGSGGAAGTGGTGGAGATGGSGGAGATGGTGGSPNEGPGHALWSRTYGSPLRDGVSAVAVNANDEAVIAGFLSNNADFSGILSIGAPGVYVARIGGDGLTSDLKVFSTGDPDPLAQPALALRSDGTAVLAGVFSGDVDFGGIVMSALNPRLFIASLDATNKAKWVATAGKDAVFETPHLAVDKNNNTFVFVDSKSGQVSYAGKSFPYTDKNAAYLLKINGNGNGQWARQFANTEFVYAHSVSVDPSDGSVYVAGKADAGTLDCGCPEGPLMMQGYSMFVAQYDSSGNCMRQLSYGFNTPPHAVVADGQGNLYVTGAHSAPFDVGGLHVDFSGGDFNFDAYVIKLSAQGIPFWARSFGVPSSDDDADELVLDPSGDVIVSGHISGVVDTKDGVILDGQTPSDLFVMRLRGSDGKAVWGRRFANVTQQQVLYSHLGIDSAGDVLVGGLFEASIDFRDADSPHPAAGALDGYLAKLSGK